MKKFAVILTGAIAAAFTTAAANAAPAGKSDLIVLTQATGTQTQTQTQTRTRLQDGTGNQTRTQTRKRLRQGGGRS